jgi:DNA-damage-inducible protein J
MVAVITKEAKMARTATIHARTDAALKAETEAIFKELGVNFTEAINLFLNQVRLRKGFPFPINVPNRVTRETFEKTDRGEDLNSYENIDEFFRKMDT